MCIYHYCYFSACRHGQLTRVSYCDKATALLLYVSSLNSVYFPKFANLVSNSRPQCIADANSSRGKQFTVSSLRSSTLEINRISSSRMDSPPQHQSQHNNTMSSVTPSEASRSSFSHNIVQNQDENETREAALVLRSGLVEEECVKREHVLNHAPSLLDSQGLGNVCIDVALSTKSSLQIDTAKNGKKSASMALFELCVGCSNVFQVSFNDLPSSPSYCTSPTIGCTVGSPHEHNEDQSVAQKTEQPQQSHRKPIPDHWLPKAASPKLATAQRAKERTLKRSSDNGSPGYPKGIRATQSSVDLGRSHGREGTTYLTKEALEAVETTMTPPRQHTGSAKFSSSTLKPAWNSPTSPLRSVARQKSGCSLKMSPTKPSHLPNKSTAADHSRLFNSVTASASKSSFHITDGSPVRSP